jgi:hypothetical protein
MMASKRISSSANRDSILDSVRTFLEVSLGIAVALVVTTVWPLTKKAVASSH